MTVHFAAARTAAANPLARMFTRRRPAQAANDNYCGKGDDQLLHAALRHFAQHGMQAAHEARREAEKAFFAGERERYLWWRGVCRTLDRRMAQEIERRGPAAIS